MANKIKHVLRNLSIQVELAEQHRPNKTCYQFHCKNCYIFDSILRTKILFDFLVNKCYLIPWVLFLIQIN